MTETTEELEESFALPEREATSTTVPIMVMDKTEEAEDSKAEEVENAFAALPFFWKDKQLAPFAISRSGDWWNLREKLGEAPLDEIITKPYAMLPDAIRVIWFLSHEPEEWLSMPDMKEVETEDGGTRWIRLTGKQQAIALEMKIRAWADEHIHNSESTLAVGLFYSIYNRANSTRAIAKPSERHDAQKSKN